MTYLLGRASVEDFEAWKAGFDSDEPFRTEHGQRSHQVFQSLDDPNEAIVLFEWDDEQDPRAFFRSAEMREQMAERGVRGQPELSALRLVDQKRVGRPSA
jgi:heme-degrading monooxygenase HmoA